MLADCDSPQPRRAKCLTLAYILPQKYLWSAEDGCTKHVWPNVSAQPNRRRCRHEVKKNIVESYWTLSSSTAVDAACASTMAERGSSPCSSCHWRRCLISRCKGHTTCKSRAYVYLDSSPPALHHQTSPASLDDHHSRPAL